MENGTINICQGYIQGGFDPSITVQQYSDIKRTNETGLIESVIKSSDFSKTFILEKKDKDTGQLSQKTNNDDIRVMNDDGFLVKYLKCKLQLRQFQDIFHVLENVENVSNPAYIEIWDEAHYRQYVFQHGGTLTPLRKFRIRQRNPPPPGICQGGNRPQRRFAESSVAVLRQWFTAHSKDPYPSRKTKLLLAEQAGIPVSKVTTWFHNARRKHKKERLNKLDEANQTINEKYQHEKGQIKTYIVHKPIKTKELGTLKSCGNAKCSEVLDNRTLHPIYKVKSEMVTQSLVTKTSCSYENAWNSSKCSVDKRVNVKSDNKQNGRKTIKFSNCLMPCQKLPSSLAVPHCKKQTINKGSAVYNKMVEGTNARGVYGYRQTKQRLTFGEKHVESKIKKINLLWKLRAKLKEKQKRGEEPDEKASNGVRTAVNCLKSFQNLGQHLENEVKSPVDHAYGVEFDNLNSKEGMAVEYDVTNGAESGILPHLSQHRPTLNDEAEAFQNLLIGTGAENRIFGRPQQYSQGDQVLLDPLDMYNSRMVSAGGIQYYQGPLDMHNSHQFSARGIQYYQGPPDMHNSHQFSAGGIQYYQGPPDMHNSRKFSAGGIQYYQGPLDMHNSRKFSAGGIQYYQGPLDVHNSHKFSAGGIQYYQGQLNMHNSHKFSAGGIQYYQGPLDMHNSHKFSARGIQYYQGPLDMHNSHKFSAGGIQYYQGPLDMHNSRKFSAGGIQYYQGPLDMHNSRKFSAGGIQYYQGPLDVHNSRKFSAGGIQYYQGPLDVHNSHKFSAGGIQYYQGQLNMHNSHKFSAGGIQYYQGPLDMHNSHKFSARGIQYYQGPLDMHNSHKFSARGIQYYQGPLDMHNSHQFSAGGIQSNRSPSTDWEDMWTPWCSHSRQDNTNMSQLDTGTSEDYHYSEIYSTSVGEAVQGLLKLSSSQEFGSNYLQDQDPDTVSHCFKFTQGQNNF